MDSQLKEELKLLDSLHISDYLKCIAETEISQYYGKYTPTDPYEIKTKG